MSVLTPHRPQSASTSPYRSTLLKNARHFRDISHGGDRGTATAHAAENTSRAATSATRVVSMFGTSPRCSPTRISGPGVGTYTPREVSPSGLSFSTARRWPEGSASVEGFSPGPGKYEVDAYKMKFRSAPRPFIASDTRCEAVLHANSLFYSPRSGKGLNPAVGQYDLPALDKGAAVSFARAMKRPLSAVTRESQSDGLATIPRWQTVGSGPAISIGKASRNHKLVQHHGEPVLCVGPSEQIPGVASYPGASDALTIAAALRIRSHRGRFSPTTPRESRTKPAPVPGPGAYDTAGSLIKPGSSFNRYLREAAEHRQECMRPHSAR